ncbi:MAG: nitric oxide reductase activation protein [Ectothiorhodospiraceae bacterium]|jgi:nitric oxide reductase NorD protein|nr:nitric oxide reductase activation protein [Ectothiorhodospiraceae bacterium]
MIKEPAPLSLDELEERLDDILGASSSHRSVERLAGCLEPMPRARQEFVLSHADMAARTFGEIAYLIVMLSPQALSMLDEAGFEAWVLASLDTYDREGLRPAMEQLRQLETFCALRAGTPVARLSEIEVRLTRFVQGLSGRPLALRPGAMAWTDTESLFLPEVLALLPDADGNRRLYKTLAVTLWAQTRFGTFNVDLEAALAQWADRQRALDWLALLEAARLEARVAAELPGLAAEMRALRGPWPEPIPSLLPRLTGAGATVACSLELLGALMQSDATPPRVPAVGSLDPATAQRVRAGRIERESRLLENAIRQLKGGAGRRPANERRDASAPSELEWSERSVDLNIDGEAVALPPEAQAAARSLVQDLGQVPPELLTPAGDGEWQPAETPGSFAPEMQNEREATLRYDEWDYHRRAYRRQWCHVYEHDVRPGDHAYVREVGVRHAPLIRQIRRRFEAVRGEDRILGRQPEGEEIDMDALVDARCDRRSGAEPSARLYRRRLRNERSLAAMFMVDMSGSTRGWVNDAEREALVMLCEAIETLGDDYAIYGFSGWTRTRCDIYRIKAFGERYDETVRARIAGIEAKDYTRMGVAIRHLARLLAARPAKHRLLVTLSDGRPDDFGDEYRSVYGIEDTRRALLEAMRSGIRPFCITLDREARDYLPQLYGAARYTVIDDVARLPYKVAEIYRRLTQ